MSEMRDRLIARAKVLTQDIDAFANDGDGHFDYMGPSPERLAQDLVDAILDTLREPDEGIMDIGYEAGYIQRGSLNDAWRAMIDSIRTRGEGDV